MPNHNDPNYEDLLQLFHPTFLLQTIFSGLKTTKNLHVWPILYFFMQKVGLQLNFIYLEANYNIFRSKVLA